MPEPHIDHRRQATRYALAAIMISAGVAHLVIPAPVRAHLPSWVPGRSVLVAVTGVMEIALGAAMLSTKGKSRTYVGLLLAGFFVAVFPANVYAAISRVPISGYPPGLLRWIRLPFQAPLVAAAIWSTRDKSLSDSPPPETPL